jgi:hypothetical protein
MRDKAFATETLRGLPARPENESSVKILKRDFDKHSKG